MTKKKTDKYENIDKLTKPSQEEVLENLKSQLNEYLALEKEKVDELKLCKNMILKIQGGIEVLTQLLEDKEQDES
jgi:hypothetical protein